MNKLKYESPELKLELVKEDIITFSPNLGDEFENPEINPEEE